MDTKAAVVIGFSLVLASAVIALGPRFAPPGAQRNTEPAKVPDELVNVKDELVKVKGELARVKDELVRLRADQAKKPTELTWAKVTACDLLDALQAGKTDFVRNLFGAEGKSYYKDNADLCNTVGGIGYEFRMGYEITDEHVAPAGDEARFKGILKGEKAGADFTLRLGKEKESGHWRVTYFGCERPKK